MRVQTTVTVPVAVVHDRQAHGRLITEARARLVDLGLASQDVLADEPAMVLSHGDLASHWVNVTFSWGRD